MCLNDVLTTLRDEGVNITENDIRAALRSGRLERPPFDGSRRFVFGPDHLARLRQLYGQREC